MAKPVRFELDASRAALLAQLTVLQQQIESLPDEVFANPTRLGEWTVGTLVAHLELALGALAAWVRAPEPASADYTLSTYYQAGRSSAGVVDDMARTAASGRGPDALRAGACASFDAVRAAAAEIAEGQVLATRIGAVIGTDALVTRCVEAVVHALDLQAATGVPQHPVDAVAPASLGLVARAVGAILQERAPGHSVEVRVPGRFGTAFQCGEGPQHTRGTPPNVVETDPVTFVELGAGRLRWADAVATGVVRASGLRADLGTLLPVIG